MKNTNLTNAKRLTSLTVIAAALFCLAASTTLLGTQSAQAEKHESGKGCSGNKGCSGEKGATNSEESGDKACSGEKGSEGKSNHEKKACSGAKGCGGEKK